MTVPAWKPGDVAATEYEGVESRAVVVEGRNCPSLHPRRPHWHARSGGWIPLNDPHVTFRSLLVIDPDDREQVESLYPRNWHRDSASIGWFQQHLRSLVGRPQPEEPTNPHTRVTDRRENIWRLLADGDWVCTSGPDIGEYVVWSQLLERGPLSLEVVTP